MTTSIHRYEIPVDGRWHTVTSGEPLHVACRQPDIIEFWASTSGPVELRHFRVYGTGWPMPEGLVYIDTALAPSGHLVWHLMSDPWKVAQ